MTKKDYERAAEIIQRWASVAAGSSERDTVAALETCFAEFFSGDSPRFDRLAFVQHARRARTSRRVGRGV